MKKILGLAIMLMMTLVAFAKEIPLQITKTEWGLEISNLNAKGKRICRFADIKTRDCFIIFKNKTDDFNIEKLYLNVYNISQKSMKNNFRAQQKTKKRKIHE